MTEVWCLDDPPSQRGRYKGFSLAIPRHRCAHAHPRFLRSGKFIAAPPGALTCLEFCLHAAESRDRPKERPCSIRLPGPECLSFTSSRAAFMQLMRHWRPAVSYCNAFSPHYRRASLRIPLPGPTSRLFSTSDFDFAASGVFTRKQLGRRRPGRFSAGVAFV